MSWGKLLLYAVSGVNAEREGEVSGAQEATTDVPLCDALSVHQLSPAVRENKPMGAVAFQPHLVHMTARRGDVEPVVLRHALVVLYVISSRQELKQI